MRTVLAILACTLLGFWLPCNAAEVHFVRDSAGEMVVPVTINGQITLKFIVDSGASGTVIPRDVVSTLIRTGTISSSDILGTTKFSLANGATITNTKIRIASLKIGSVTLKNVTAYVGDKNSSLLLGETVLRRFSSWKVNNLTKVITFGSEIALPKPKWVDIAGNEKFTIYVRTGSVRTFRTNNGIPYIIGVFDIFSNANNTQTYVYGSVFKRSCATRTGLVFLISSKDKLLAKFVITPTSVTPPTNMLIYLCKSVGQ